MRKLLWVLVSVLSLSACEADKEVREWEFVGMRAPSSDDITYTDADYKSFLMMECSEQLDKHYQIYVKKHPEFAAYKNLPGIRERWMLAMIRENHRRRISYGGSCVYDLILDAIWEFTDYDPTRYDRGMCGVGGAGMRKSEAINIRRMRTVVELAVRGDFYAAISLFSAGHQPSSFVLNPELRFYVVEVLKRDYSEVMTTIDKEDSPEIPDNETGLSVERMADLRAAVERRDTSIVLNEWFTCFKLKQ